MTNDEIIKFLQSKQLPQCGDKEYTADEEYEAYQRAIDALEQHPCEDEYIKVPKKALKYRTAGMVAYNAEWLKKHWQMELKIMGKT